MRIALNYANMILGIVSIKRVFYVCVYVLYKILTISNFCNLI